MGVLLTLSFAPYDFAYAALPALIFLYWSWTTQRLKHALLQTYAFGLGLFGSGIWWVFVSVHDFGGADGFSASMLTLLLVGLWALFPALSAFLTLSLVLKSPGVWVRIMASAWLWVAVEYIRGNLVLNGFPWLQLAYSQLHTPLAAYAPIIGVYGVGFLLAATAFAGSEVLRRKLRPLNYLCFVLLIWGGGGLLQFVPWTHSVGAPIKVTLVQGNISQDQKWLPEQRTDTLSLYQVLTQQHWDSQVIIWPETAIPAFLSDVKESYLDPLTAEARQHQVDLVVSLPSGDGKEYYNSVLALSEKPALYQKNHLLPFGEYLPLQPVSGWILDKLEIPLGDFTAGADRQPLLSAGGYAFTTTICYEDAYGEQVTRQIADAAYIVNVTNDAWFGDTSQPYQHMQMAQMRALETGRFLVRATNTGLTGFVGPDGKIRKQAPLFVTTTLTDSIVPMTGVTPYVQMGDQGVFALLSAWVLLLHLLTSWVIHRKRLNARQ